MLKGVGHYTGVSDSKLYDLFKAVKDKVDSADCDDALHMSSIMDDILDDIRSFIQREDLLSLLFSNLAEAASLDDIKKRVKSECDIADVYDNDVIENALSSSAHLAAVQDKDIMKYCREHFSVDVFDTKELESWAEDNGYQLTPEEVISRAHE